MKVGVKRRDATKVAFDFEGLVTTRRLAVPVSQRVTGVKAETLALVINEVKRAGIDRIELVLDNKKINPLTQSTVPPNTRLEQTRR
jgi:hypothetical protein